MHGRHAAHSQACRAADRALYSKCDLAARKLLWLRRNNRLGAHEANMALAVRDAFVQVCLVGQCLGGKPGVPSVEDARQVCTGRPARPPTHCCLCSVRTPTSLPCSQLTP